MEAASPPFHGGEVAVPYKTVGLMATGGVQPYTWTLGAGALPGGLSLSTEGHVTGTPTKAGHFSFTIVVSDSGGGKASLNAAATIVPALTVNFLRACGSTGKCSVEQGCVSVCGGFGYQGGGSAPYSYKLTGGSVPPGTYQYGLSLAGKFTATGTFNFKATLTDGYGATASLSPTFTVFPHIALASGSCDRVFTPCSLQLKITGGAPGGTPTVTIASVAAHSGGCWPGAPTPLPPYTLSVGGGYVSLNIPRPGSGYGALWTLIVTDKSLCAAGSYCSSPGATATIGIECT
jgi:hypothetical protein